MRVGGKSKRRSPPGSCLATPFEAAQIKTKTKTKTKTKHLPNALVWPRARSRQIDFTASLASIVHSQAQNDSRGKVQTTTLGSYDPMKRGTIVGNVHSNKYFSTQMISEQRIPLDGKTHP